MCWFPPNLYRHQKTTRNQTTTCTKPAQAFVLKHKNTVYRLPTLTRWSDFCFCLLFSWCLCRFCQDLPLFFVLSCNLPRFFVFEILRSGSGSMHRDDLVRWIICLLAIYHILVWDGVNINIIISNLYVESYQTASNHCSHLQN